MDADPRAESLLAGGPAARFAFKTLACLLAGMGPADVARRFGRLVPGLPGEPQVWQPMSRQAIYRAGPVAVAAGYGEEWRDYWASVEAADAARRAAKATRPKRGPGRPRGPYSKRGARLNVVAVRDADLDDDTGEPRATRAA